MADNHIQDMLKRIAAMQMEAIGPDTALSPPLDTAKSFWPYQQSTLPYMVNRLGTSTVDYDTYSEEIQGIGYTVLMRLVVDHVGAAYEGGTANLAYQYIQPLQEYFRNHPLLTTDAGDYTDPPDYLFFDAQLLSHTGLISFLNFGGMNIQLGVEFTLQIPFLREVDK